MQVQPLAMLGSVFGVDGLVLLIIGLLIFGRRLPEVGKNIGQTIVEFKKGLNSHGLGDADQHEEPISEAPINRNLSKPAPRITASAPRAKSLPSTEEV